MELMGWQIRWIFFSSTLRLLSYSAFLCLSNETYADRWFPSIVLLHLLLILQFWKYLLPNKFPCFSSLSQLISTILTVHPYFHQSSLITLKITYSLNYLFRQSNGFGFLDPWIADFTRLGVGVWIFTPLVSYLGHFTKMLNIFSSEICWILSTLNNPKKYFSTNSICL